MYERKEPLFREEESKDKIPSQLEFTLLFLGIVIIGWFTSMICVAIAG